MRPPPPPPFAAASSRQVCPPTKEMLKESLALERVRHATQASNPRLADTRLAGPRLAGPRRADPRQVWSATHTCGPRLGQLAWEVRRKYPHDENLIELFQRFFMLLPVASVVGSWAFVIHGGLFRDTEVTLLPS